ncbi:MAG TPA: dihydroorotate dehydrogenase-like protein [bacterium]|nr:dihydroorotate dehydrogenase-like protein [bacterium]
MADLTTRYLGLTLRNPVIAASSGLTQSIDSIRKLEQAGAGAVVLKSIFEEQILLETCEQLEGTDFGVHPEAMDYLTRMTHEHSIGGYLDLIRQAKETLKIPVIANVNCLTDGEWARFSSKIEEAGADALELNVLHIDDADRDPAGIEANYFRIVEAVGSRVSIPVTMKIGTLFSNLPQMILRLGNDTGLSGLTLFNRYWSPDIDVETRRIVPAEPFSAPEEISVPLRWIGLVSDRIACDIAASTGVYGGKDVIKLLMAGATTVQMCSALYKNGIAYLEAVIRELDAWLDTHGIPSLDEIRGTSAARTPEQRLLYGRMQFMKRYATGE